MILKNNNFNRITFEEIGDYFSHYEIAFLSFCKASDIVLSGASLLSNSPYKPKVAIVAYNQICSDLEATKQYKEEVVLRYNSKYEDVVDDEDYTIEDF